MDNNILWIEDDETFKAEMEEGMGSLFDITFVNSSEEALVMLKNQTPRYRLVVVDLYLDDKTPDKGFEAVKRINDKFPRIPIVVVSNAKVIDLSQALDYGAKKILAKDEIKLEDWGLLFIKLIKQPSIFLSYSSVDKIFTKNLKKRLEPYCKEVWLDEVKIKIGDSIIKKIGEGIKKSDALIVILSKSSINSKWVIEELDIGLTYQIMGKQFKVLPVAIDNSEPPPFLIGKRYCKCQELSSIPSIEKTISKINKLNNTFPEHFQKYINIAIKDFNTEIEFLWHEKINELLDSIP